MRRHTLALAAALICAAGGSDSDAQSPRLANPSGVALAGHGVSPVGCTTCGETSCGCDPAGLEIDWQAPCGGCDSGCDSCSPGICFDGGGCDNGCPTGGCSCGGISKLSCFDNCGSDPYELLGHCGNLRTGGWLQLGYHDQNLPAFNNRKYELQLQQAWLFAEKELDTCVGGDIGGRIDYIYGTDGPNTQAFGIDNDSWDNDWDNGPDNLGYGSAIPQLYLNAGYGDFSVKVGHFYTIIGNEVVQAPQNFFYSHAYTFNFSEPFTHTGVLSTYEMTKDVTLYNGWVLGWDSGFEDNGDAYLGGFSVNVTDDINVTSTSVIGRFVDNSAANARGYMHSLVASVKLTPELDYIFQSDILDSEDNNDQTVRDTVGINQYLIHSINDCLSFGIRAEWWHVEGDSRGFYLNPPSANLASSDFDVYELTLGMNARPCANVVIRPEIRWDWVDGPLQDLNNAGLQILEDNGEHQTTFGIDTIFLF